VARNGYTDPECVFNDAASSEITFENAMINQQI
jgi:hypothetical protein